MANKVIAVTTYHASVTTPKEFYFKLYDADGIPQDCAAYWGVLYDLCKKAHTLMHDRRRCINWDDADIDGERLAAEHVLGIFRLRQRRGRKSDTRGREKGNGSSHLKFLP